MPRANACPRGGPVVPPRPYLDEFGKLLRWNGCGCRVVLRWTSNSHRRRGPRSGHITCLKRTPAASVPAASSRWSPRPLVEANHREESKWLNSCGFAASRSRTGYDIRVSQHPPHGGLLKAGRAWLAQRGGRPMHGVWCRSSVTAPAGGRGGAQMRQCDPRGSVS